MADDFIPLAPREKTATGGAPFRLRVVPPETAPAVFSPLSPGSLASSGGHAHGEPSVTLRKEGERVTGLRVRCSCGQVLELDFVF